MSKLITVYRASGMPVNEANIDLFATAHREFYDKLQNKYMPDKTKVPTQEQAEKMSKALSRWEKRLYRKYPNSDQWEFIKSKRAMQKRINEIGFPIATAVNAANKELVYIILDVEF